MMESRWNSGWPRAGCAGTPPRLGWFFLDKIFRARKVKFVKRKTNLILSAVLILSTVQIFAQASIGNDAGIVSGNENHAASLLIKLNGFYYASIGGKIYDLRTSGTIVSGSVKYISDGIIVIDHGLVDVAIKNYKGEATVDKTITVCAIHTGTYDWNSVPLQLWDCGTKPTAEQMQQIKAEEDKAQEIIDQQTAALKQAARQKMLQGQTNAVHWLFSQATNGDVFAQCSLGEHYLAGLGCETNRDLAIQWLRKAADGGSMEASNKLAQLKLP